MFENLPGLLFVFVCIFMHYDNRNISEEKKRGSYNFFLLCRQTNIQKRFPLLLKENFPPVWSSFPFILKAVETLVVDTSSLEKGPSSDM